MKQLTRPKPVVGQKVYRVNTRRGDADSNAIVETEVVRIGNKYFYCKIYGREQAFHLDTWAQKSSDYVEWLLYSSIQEIDQIRAKRAMSTKVYQAIAGSKSANFPEDYSLVQLKTISNIIDDVTQAKERHEKS